jgi:hypothetical protein
MSIMTHILNEEASQTVLDVIMRNLVKEGKVSGLCLFWIHIVVAVFYYYYHYYYFYILNCASLILLDFSQLNKKYFP